MAINPKYIDFPITIDSRSLLDRSIAYLQAKIPGWTPSEGQLDAWILEATSGEAGVIGSLTTQVPKSLFRFYGKKLFGVNPVDASYATATATVYAIDTAGYTIPAGMQVGIYDAFGQLVPFTVLQDVIIPAGQDHADVVLVANLPGTVSDGLGAISGTIQLIDILAWVDHITQLTVSAGGQDAESDDQYLSRLALVLQTMTPTPILPRDFAILARNVAGVQRAAAVDGYNPDDMTFNNERLVCVVALDDTGTPVGSPVKTAISAYLESLRETTFVVKTTDADVQQIDVTVTLKVLDGYSSSDVATRVSSAIQNFLNPTLWGIDNADDPNNPSTWNNISVIYYLELASVINNVSGVDRILSLTQGLHSGAQSAADLSLAGVVPLPNVGTIVVNVT